MKNNLVRVNTRIPVYMNEWLDEHSEKIGLSKSTLIHLAIDTYIKQDTALNNTTDMVRELRELKERLPVED